MPGALHTTRRRRGMAHPFPRPKSAKRAPARSRGPRRPDCFRPTWLARRPPARPRSPVPSLSGPYDEALAGRSPAQVDGQLAVAEGGGGGGAEAVGELEGALVGPVVPLVQQVVLGRRRAHG